MIVKVREVYRRFVARFMVVETYRTEATNSYSKGRKVSNIQNPGKFDVPFRDFTCHPELVLTLPNIKKDD
jgi:hypothetical protein